MTPGSVSVPEHLERFLGEIEVGWHAPSVEVHQPVQIVRFRQQAFGGTAFATLGLSLRDLRSRSSNRLLRQELVMIVSASAEGVVPGILDQVLSEVAASGEAILRGDVIGPRGKLFEGSEMEALYATVPAYLPDDFAALDVDDHSVAFSWLVPISHGESHYVLSHGWQRFEERLAEADPDLVDVYGRDVVA